MVDQETRDGGRAPDEQPLAAASDAHAESADADLGGSTTDDSSLTPDSAERPSALAAFEEFVERDEDAPPVDDAVEEAPAEEPEAEEAQEEPAPEEPEEGEATEETEDEEEVDLSDLVPEQAAAEDDEWLKDFNPRKGLPSTVWKKLPQEARDFITRHQRLNKKMLREQEAVKPTAEWAQKVISRAKEVEIDQGTLDKWVDLGLALQRGDQQAAAKLGDLAQRAGYKLPEPQAPELDMEVVDDYLHDLVGEFVIDKEQAKTLRAKIRESVKTKAAPSAPPPQPAPPQAPPPPAAPASNQESVREAAMQTILQMQARYEARYGSEWPDLKAAIVREVAMAQTALPQPIEKLPGLWAEAAKRQEKALRERKGKVRRDGPREQSRGASTHTGGSSSPKLSSSADFLKRFAY